MNELTLTGEEHVEFGGLGEMNNQHCQVGGHLLGGSSAHQKTHEVVLLHDTAQNSQLLRASKSSAAVLFHSQKSTLLTIIPTY